MEFFTRVIAKQGYKSWLDKLREINGLITQVSYLTVKNKFRAAGTVLVNPESLEEELKKFTKDGLVFLPLGKVALRPFCYMGRTIPPEPGESYVWSGCIARNRDNALMYMKTEHACDHKKRGQLLGYPDCCINYFVRNFPLNPVPIWEDLEGRIKGYPECNILLVYFGLRMVPYIPCSPICEATRKIGKIWWNFAKELNRDLVKDLYQLLAGSITWNSYHGVVQVETPYFLGLNSSFPYLKRPRIIRWKGVEEKNNLQRRNS